MTTDSQIVQTGNEAPAVVLFDGVCNFCNGSVNFILDRDPNAYFRFALLRSDVAEQILAGADLAGRRSTPLFSWRMMTSTSGPWQRSELRDA